MKDWDCEAEARRCSLSFAFTLPVVGLAVGGGGLRGQLTVDTWELGLDLGLSLELRLWVEGEPRPMVREERELVMLDRGRRGRGRVLVRRLRVSRWVAILYRGYVELRRCAECELMLGMNCCRIPNETRKRP